MIVAAIIVSLIIGIVIGFLVGIYAFRGYMKYCILKGTVHLEGKELDALKKFVNYDEKKTAKMAEKTDRGESILSRFQRKP